jgi:lysophospholipase L1-like esterase
VTLTLSTATELLFIGDSITDCGRQSDPEGLGFGYVRLVRDMLAAHEPATLPVIVNCGVSGDRMPDLQARWQIDVLDRAPDIVSIYIGINDVWHALMPGCQGTTLGAFVAGYRDILSRTRQALPATRLVLCEPSVIRPPGHEQVNALLKPYVAVVHQMAAEFAAAGVVALHGAFERVRATRPDVAWTTDGVHPTSAGHMLIAQTWLGATGLP